MVGRHPTIQLIPRRPVPRRARTFDRPPMPAAGVMGDYPRFPMAVPLRGVGCRRLTHPYATPPRGVRLACLIHAANVHSEPGSNPSKSCGPGPPPPRNRFEESMLVAGHASRPGPAKGPADAADSCCCPAPNADSPRRVHRRLAAGGQATHPVAGPPRGLAGQLMTETPRRTACPEHACRLGSFADPRRTDRSRSHTSVAAAPPPGGPTARPARPPRSRRHGVRPFVSIRVIDRIAKVPPWSARCRLGPRPGRPPVAEGPPVSGGRLRRVGPPGPPRRQSPAESISRRRCCCLIPASRGRLVRRPASGVSRQRQELYYRRSSPVNTPARKMWKNRRAAVVAVDIFSQSERRWHRPSRGRWFTRASRGLEGSSHTAAVDPGMTEHPGGVSCRADRQGASGSRMRGSREGVRTCPSPCRPRPTG